MAGLDPAIQPIRLEPSDGKTGWPPQGRPWRIEWAPPRV